MGHRLTERAARLAQRLYADVGAPHLPRTPMTEWTEDELLTAMAWGLWRDATPDGLAAARRLALADVKLVAEGDHVERPPR